MMFLQARTLKWKTPAPDNPGGRFSVQVSSAKAEPAWLVQLSSDLVELRAGVSTNRLNRCKANDNNQGKHDGVLNCCWAIFRLQKTLYF